MSLFDSVIGMIFVIHAKGAGPRSAVGRAPDL